MLELDVLGIELLDESTNMFVYTEPMSIKLEHSLISVSKWEGLWEKPFLPTRPFIKGINGFEEEVSYIECMIIGKYEPHASAALYQQYMATISNYMNKPHSATVIKSIGPEISRSREVITSEVIYYLMAKFGIPFECEKWHFNRLLTLLQVCNVKESKGKGSKLSTKETLNWMVQLNKERQGLL